VFFEILPSLFPPGDLLVPTFSFVFASLEGPSIFFAEMVSAPCDRRLSPANTISNC
jgi:hypothetical protein